MKTTNQSNPLLRLLAGLGLVIGLSLGAATLSGCESDPADDAADAIDDAADEVGDAIDDATD